jgi:adenylate cyclase
MARDEIGTISHLKASRAIIDRLISSHHGRIFTTAGDSVIADFASAVEAVQCAVSVQEALAAENADRDADERMAFRIGIHVGDVIVDGSNLLGDGVNIAARLEAFAEPGGFCVSSAIREQIGGRLPIVFDDLGERQVKNIARPVQVYRVRPESAAAAVAPSADPLVLPDKPSVAVLPFANMSSDPEQEFLADGIAEDVITALSRFGSLFVIARNSSFTYKGRAVDVKQVGHELGVRYLLEGSLRKAGNRIRVTAQLVEANTSNHVWAERYDRDLADIFAVQDEISQAVTIAIAPAIAQAERQRAMRKPPGNLDAWASYQRGCWHIGKATAEDTRLAHDFFQRATELDPSFAGGYIGLASAISAAATAFGTAALAETQSREESLARRAISLDPSNAEAYVCLSVALRDSGDLAGALAEADRAVTLCPNLASAHGRKGQALVFSGEPRAGIDALETALRLDPRSPIMWRELQYLTVGRYLCRDYEVAVETAERVIRLYPAFRLPYRWLAAALGQLGGTDDARRVLEQAIALSAPVHGGFTRTAFPNLPWMRPAVTAHLFEGLRKAGWEG